MKNEIQFDSTKPELLRQLIKEHGDSEFPFFGTNAEGETIKISVSNDSIVLETYQHNGWTRKNYFDENGYPNGEMFEK